MTGDVVNKHETYAVNGAHEKAMSEHTQETSLDEGEENGSVPRDNGYNTTVAIVDQVNI